MSEEKPPALGQEAALIAGGILSLCLLVAVVMGLVPR